MKADTYIQFNGNCESAMNYYKEVLDGELTVLMRFSEAPPETMQVPEGAKDLIMHSTLSFDGCIIMGSDTIGPPLVEGNNFSVSIGTDEVRAEKIYNSLMESGTSIMPFEAAFWGGKFGMLKDKFGIQWMVSSDHKPES